ncbi:MAG: DNA-binding transcriptional LysR family regulator [Pseudomonadales bacterium]|jgi:DNA-binding transcriptional LysR family regulator
MIWSAMKNLPIDVLRTFVSVAELGGFTQAGISVGRSQPAVSLQIKKLEDGLGVSLLHRQGHNLELSTHGSLLYSYAKKILALNDEAMLSLNPPAVAGKLRFGIPSEFATTLLPKVVGRFANNYPGVELEVVSDLSKNLVANDRRSDFDLILALQDQPAEGDKGLVHTDDLVWVAGKQWRSTDGELPLLAAPEPCIYRERALQVLKKEGRPWRIVYTNSDLTGLQAAIAEGLGVTVLARSVVPPSLKIVGKAEGLMPLGKIGISLLYDRRKNNEAVARLVEYVSASLAR